MLTSYTSGVCIAVGEHVRCAVCAKVSETGKKVGGNDY
jgi:hypothetical protein